MKEYGCGCMATLVAFFLLGVVIEHPAALIVLALLLIAFTIFYYFERSLAVNAELSMDDENLNELTAFCFSDEYTRLRKEMLQFMKQYKKEHGRYPTYGDEDFKIAFENEAPDCILDECDFHPVLLLTLERAELESPRSIAFEFIFAYEEVIGSGFEKGFSTLFLYRFMDEGAEDTIFHPFSSACDPYKLFHLLTARYSGKNDLRETRVILRQAKEEFNRVMSQRRADEVKRQYGVDPEG